MRTVFPLGLVAVLPVTGCSSPAEPTLTDATAQFNGTWLCNFTLVQASGSTQYTTNYQSSPVKTVTSGNALSVYGEESDSEPQSWFCGFNYSIVDGSVALAGTPTCRSNSVVALQSAAVSLAPGGNEMTLQESGTEDDGVDVLQSTMSGVCARNENEVRAVEIVRDLGCRHSRAWRFTTSLPLRIPAAVRAIGRNGVEDRAEL